MSEQQVKVVDVQEIVPSAISEIPIYQCFKQVRAFEITKIDPIVDGGGKALVSGAEHRVVVESDWLEHFKPQVGMMIVFYEEGYISVSPKVTFDKGYILLK